MDIFTSWLLFLRSSGSFVHWKEGPNLLLSHPSIYNITSIILYTNILISNIQYTMLILTEIT